MGEKFKTDTVGAGGGCGRAFAADEDSARGAAAAGDAQGRRRHGGPRAAGAPGAAAALKGLAEREHARAQGGRARSAAGGDARKEYHHIKGHHILLENISVVHTYSRTKIAQAVENEIIFMKATREDNVL